ncbi:MAG: hydroxymethylbilane synthase [Crocinitomicaceae bacterium]|nr:hydroxymethylbilane synthase [Crocinitomicaceae bacterium]
MAKKIIIGSRGSDLALWQANFVLDELRKLKIEAEIKIIKTQGDKIQDLSFDKLEGKGFFTKEIEEALLNGEIDLAVHSHKDLPTDSPKGLMIAAVSEREDPSELLLVHKSAVDENQKFSLKQNALVGTSSARRKSQLLAWRPDVKLQDLRGNVPTRIQKLRDKKYDAILIAYAGVSRLKIDLSEFHCEKLDPNEFIPAPAQGVLALQIREADTELFKKLQPLNSKDVAEAIAVERKVLNLFDGGCQLPLGAFCTREENQNGDLIFKVRVAKADNANTFPRHFYFEARKSAGFSEKIVQKIEQLVPGTVFITHDERKNVFLKRTLEANGFKVYAHSLIDVKNVPMTRFVKTDWVFFSSRNAVKYFFEQGPDVSGSKFGAIGKSTAEELKQFGERASFIGNSADSKMTGKKFSALVGNGTVLFPQAKESMRTIQLQFPGKENILDVIVYETVKAKQAPNPAAVKANFLVFTSPSNVGAFLEKNNITSSQKIIAMGDATSAALTKKNIVVHNKPASFDDLGLIQAIRSI